MARAVLQMSLTAKAATITFAERAETSPVDSSELVLSHISGKLLHREVTPTVCARCSDLTVVLSA